MGGYQPRPRARCTVGRILDNDLITRIKNIFLKYQEVPLLLIPTIYHFEYEEYLDAGKLGFDNGLTGLFEELKDLVKIKLNDGLKICTLTDQCKPKLIASRNTTSPCKALSEISIHSYVKQVHNRRREKNLFDQENIHLWPSKFRKLLNYDLNNLVIAQSPLELALERSGRMAYETISVHKFLSNHPDGIKLNEIGSLYPLDKRLYNATSYAALVEEYPELFFIVNSNNENEEPLVYDGVTHSYGNLTSHNLKKLGYNSSLLAYQSITSGIYQKTLLLLRKSGKDGLKLSVWNKSVKSNFLDIEISDADQVKTINKLLSLEPLTLFLHLVSFGMIELKSHRNCKNDIRIHFPAQNINFREFINELEEAILEKSNSYEKYRNTLGDTSLGYNSFTQDENNNDI